MTNFQTVAEFFHITDEVRSMSTILVAYLNSIALLEVRSD